MIRASMGGPPKILSLKYSLQPHPQLLPSPRLLRQALAIRVAGAPEAEVAVAEAEEVSPPPLSSRTRKSPQSSPSSAPSVSTAQLSPASKRPFCEPAQPSRRPQSSRATSPSALPAPTSGRSSST